MKNGPKELIADGWGEYRNSSEFECRHIAQKVSDLIIKTYNSRFPKRKY